MTMRALVLGLTAWLCSACATSQPFTPPESGGPAWTLFTTQHFLVRTDLPESTALATVEELERCYATLADVAFPFAARPGGRTSVLIVRNQAEQELFGPLGGPAFFRPGSDDFGKHPTVYLHGSLSEDARRTVQHELVHRFVHFYFPGAPAWLNEGLAQYYETTTIEDGKVVLGRPPPDQLFRAGNQWGFEQRSTGMRVWVATADVPTIAELRARTTADFHRRTDEPDLRVDDSRRVTANYAGSWALVHMLKSSPEPYPFGLEAFMLGIGAGDESTHAWSEAFQGVDAAKLEADFQAYLLKGERIVLRAPYQPPAPKIEKVEEMAPVDVHLLWAYIMPTLERKRREIGEANLLAPGSPEVLLARGRLAASEGKTAEAEKFLRDAVAARPDDERLLLALFSHLMPDEHAPTQQQIAALDALVPAMRRMARSATTINSLAWYLVVRGQPDVELALKAVDADFACWECHDTLAAAYFAKGSVDRAFISQTMALNLMPDGTRAPGALARWDQYRAAYARTKQ